MRRNKFNLSHYRLFTGDMGLLIPCGLIEVLPGDTFQHSTSMLLRMSPMVAPVMHPIEVRLHHFFVPHRLVWDGWEDFITGGADGNDTSTIPQFTSNATSGNLEDYYGLPRNSGLSFNALPIRGYNAIWNEFYRDQDLQSEVNLFDKNTLHVSWEKDYFTAARPWEQKGDAVTIPIGDEAPVVGAVAELDNVTTPATIMDLRRAVALQRFAEARARYGSRYTEYLRYLGVTPKDSRLERPEYLGGGKVNVAISEVLQTAPETVVAGSEYGVGDLYGHGIGAMRTNAYRRFFDEHGYIHSLMSVRPKAMYMSSIPRHWLKLDREDYWQRELQHIGEQEVWAGEIAFFAGHGLRDIFGYGPRYREYMEQMSQIAGDFRSTLNYWHLGRSFGVLPTLNSDFIECDPSKRIFADQTNHSMWCMAQHKVVARRLVERSNSSKVV